MRTTDLLNVVDGRQIPVTSNGNPLILPNGPTSGLETSGRISKQPNVVCLRRPVGAICRCQKAAAVPDMHFATSGIDEPTSFQHLKPNGNSWASCAEHDGEKLMGDRKTVTLHPIITHQKPSRQTLFKV